jgi:peptidoglycan/xylan/chitin deacetylase (PgdA/CDA1 family)
MTDVLALCYHAVSPTWEADLSVTPDSLERQLDYLLKRGWSPATFTEAVVNPPAPRTLAVTFDDAFASIKTHAQPLLAGLGVPATVFAPTAYVSAEKRLAWSGIDHWVPTPDAAELTALTWNDLGELTELGWEIGSHTQTHPRLTQLDDDQLEVELAESRGECDRRLGGSCRSVAYPYGDVDERVAQAARRTGYDVGAALSSRLQRLGPHRQPRVGIYHADVGWRFRLKASRSIRELQASRIGSLRS